MLTSKQMTEFLASQRIVSRASPPHTHERNGIAERAIRTVFDTARALLRQAELHKKFWPIALQHAVFLRNQAPTSALGGRTPAQVLAGDARVKLPRLYKFGCKVFVKVDESGRRALDDKARVGIYVGHNTLSNSHRVLLRNSTRWDVVDTIHCTIDESALASNLARSTPRLSPRPTSCLSWPRRRSPTPLLLLLQCLHPLRPSSRLPSPQSTSRAIRCSTTLTATRTRT